MVGKVFDRMESIRPMATKAERKLIEELRQIDKNALIYLSITELSGLVDVAEATIVRFCRKLGYKGFQDFKLSLSQELGSEPKDTHSRPQQIAEDMIDAITETSKQIDHEVCLGIARRMVQAGKICVFAVGNSSIASLAVRYRLLRAGINVDASSDPHIQSIAVANLNEHDFLILISISGSTKDILSLAEIAKKRSVPVLVITNYDKSPLVKYADWVLLSSKKEAANEGGSLIGTVTQAYVADVLCTAVYEVLGGDAAEMRFRASDAVADKAL